MNMKISENGIKFIAKWEGKRNEVYKDVRGFDTIGIGHLIKNGEAIPHKLSDEQVYDLFKKDIKIFENALNLSIKIEINQNQFDALLSLAFNIGIGAFHRSTLLRLLNQNKKELIPEQFERWIYAGKAKCQGLINRRKAERDLFLS